MPVGDGDIEEWSDADIASAVEEVIAAGTLLQQELEEREIDAADALDMLDTVARIKERNAKMLGRLIGDDVITPEIIEHLVGTFIGAIEDAELDNESRGRLADALARRCRRGFGTADSASQT